MWRAAAEYFLGPWDKAGLLGEIEEEGSWLFLKFFIGAQRKLKIQAEGEGNFLLCASFLRRYNLAMTELIR